MKQSIQNVIHHTGIIGDFSFTSFHVLKVYLAVKVETTREKMDLLCGFAVIGVLFW